MPIQKRTQAFSAFTRDLLKSGETHGVDFKKIPNGISTEDLVAFANSEGGQIIVGVVEKSVAGVQVGEVCGCDVSDAAILQILNKASSCIPPVSIDVFLENLSQKPILRLAIPASETKPHCTPKGLYCCRDGTRTRPLHPSELLKIFLDTEAKAFAGRFEAAADRISGDLSELEDTLDASIKRMADQLGWAEFNLGDTESTVDSILAHVRHMVDDTNDIGTRLRTIFRQDDRDDPIRNRERKKFIDELVKEINEKPGVRRAVLAGAELSVSAHGRAAVELTKKDLREAYDEAVKLVRRMNDLKKYTLECKAPADCSEADLDRFAALVTQGGEVADGMRERVSTAHLLGFIKYEGHAVGVAALKKPKATYRKKVFEQAKSERSGADFLFEVGWIFLKENHRQKGQMTELLTTMFEAVTGKRIFATTRSANEVMKQVLTHFKFETSGDPYPSVEHPDETIQLFLREA